MDFELDKNEQLGSAGETGQMPSGAYKAKDKTSEELIQQRRLQYFKVKIKDTLAKIADDIGKLRYELYVAMVDKCDDYSELREMAELEMQLQFIEYTKGNIEQPLRDRQVDISDLNKICLGTDKAKFMPSEEDEIETDGMFGVIEQEGGKEMLAFALQRAIDNTPISRDFHPGYSDEEVEQVLEEAEDEAELEDIGLFADSADEEEDEADEDGDEAEDEDEELDLLLGDSDDEEDEHEYTEDEIREAEDDFNNLVDAFVNGRMSGSGEIRSPEELGASDDEKLGGDGDSDDLDGIYEACDPSREGGEIEQFYGGELDLGEGYDYGAADSEDGSEDSGDDLEGMFDDSGEDDEDDEESDGDSEDSDEDDEESDEDGFDDLFPSGMPSIQVELGTGDDEEDSEDEEEAEEEAEEEEMDDLFDIDGDDSSDDDGSAADDSGSEDSDDGFDDMFGDDEDAGEEVSEEEDKADEKPKSPPPPMRLPPLPKAKPEENTKQDEPAPPPPMRLPPLPGMTPAAGAEQKKDQEGTEEKKSGAAGPKARTVRPPLAPRKISEGQVFTDPATQKMFERLTGMGEKAKKIGDQTAGTIKRAAVNQVSEASKRLANPDKKEDFFSLPDE